MRATKTLAEEHRWIQSMLACLDRLAESALGKGRLDAETSLELLELLASFADGDHQDREEKTLMPLLLSRASISEQEEIRSFADDHARERRLMLRMHSNLLAAIHGEPLGLREFVRLSREYAALHRVHMTNEESVLLPLAERLLTPSDDARILEGFSAVAAASSITREHVAQRIEGLRRRLDDVDQVTALDQEEETS